MKFENVWNGLTYARRTALLKDAGYNKSHAGRVYQYLPKMVKEDVEFCFNRSQAISNKKAA